jgi:hypothetical protein
MATSTLDSTWNEIVIPLVTVPARVKTILEITTTVGAAVESCRALTAITLDEEVEAKVKQYMTSKLLVCQALTKVSRRPEVY